MTKFPPVSEAESLAWIYGSEFAVDLVQFGLGLGAPRGSRAYMEASDLELFAFRLFRDVVDLLESSDSELLDCLRENAHNVSKGFHVLEGEFPSHDYRQKVRMSNRKKLEEIGEYGLIARFVEEEEKWKRRQREWPEKHRLEMKRRRWDG